MRHQINITEAVEIVQRARQPKGWSFHREILDALLGQDGAAGLRIYAGRDARGQDTPVVVAVTKDGADIVGLIAEEAKPCPPYCDAGSPLA